MKQKVLLFSWLLFAAAATLAQSAASSSPSNPPPAAAAPNGTAPAPAPEAPAPAAEPKPKSFPKKATIKRRVPLDPPASAVAKSDAVNVRAQPGFNGEVLGHLKKGETVMVQAEITLSHAPKGEPDQWSQIALPADLPVWVDSRLIDSDAHTVKPRRINLRGGPGEEFSIVGRLEKGTTVTEIRKKNGWMAIQAPSNACAFVAASFLDIQPAPASAPEAPPPVVEAPAVTAAVAATNTPPPAPASPSPNEPPPAAPAEAAAPAPVAPAPTAQGQTDEEIAALRHVETPTNAAEVKPRIVTREGYVHLVLSVQAPASFELHDVETDTLIEFLQPAPSANINLRPFVGARVSVTGPELVEKRWPRTPILQVQSIGLIP